MNPFHGQPRHICLWFCVPSTGNRSAKHRHFHKSANPGSRPFPAYVTSSNPCRQQQPSRCKHRRQAPCFLFNLISCYMHTIHSHCPRDTTTPIASSKTRHREGKALPPSTVDPTENPHRSTSRSLRPERLAYSQSAVATETVDIKKRCHMQCICCMCAPRFQQEGRTRHITALRRKVGSWSAVLPSNADASSSIARNERVSPDAR